MKTCILRGVPSSLRQDGWWLGPIDPTRPLKSQSHAAQNLDRNTTQSSARYALHALLLAGLIVVALVPERPDAPAVSPAETAGARSEAGVLDFRKATGLRSLAPVPQQGIAL